MAQTQTIAFYKGEAIALDCQVANYDVCPPVPVDITGWVIVLTITLTPTTFLTKAAIMNAPSAGQFTFALSHAETVAMSVGAHAYDIQRTDAGFEAVLTIGSLRLLQEVLY